MHVAAMREELESRELSYEKEWEIKLICCALLKWSLCNDWIKANPNTDVKVYDDDNKKTKSSYNKDWQASLWGFLHEGVGISQV
jgi:hypothetical protein